MLHVGERADAPAGSRKQGGEAPLRRLRRGEGETLGEIQGRREGDPSVLVSKNKNAIEVLNWNPTYNDINKIIKSAWNWHNREKC